MSALLLTCSPAAAVTPPVADPAALPADPAPTPAGLIQRGECVTTGFIPGTDPASANPSQQLLNLADAWNYSRGEGQTVAIIDTGVRPGPRLPNVDPGGDYVGASDGLADCDGHGTAVAGLVAGQPGDDGFAGVAPAARLVSIRQASAKFAPRTASDDPAAAQAQLNIDTLARAIVHAADLGAGVIIVGTVTCLPAAQTLDQAALGAAVRYAGGDRDAVVVAAAGNAGVGSTGCESNPLTDLTNPADARNWGGVTSVSIPSWWQPYVLSVGSLTADARPSGFTMAGPWVGAAAPGEGIVSLSNGDNAGLANGVPTGNGLAPMNGTGYAAAYVAGVAALVRSRFPALTAAQVTERITRTAQNPARSPSNLIGVGLVDPVAALTWTLPGIEPRVGLTEAVIAPAAPPPTDPIPRIVAFTGVGLLAVAVVVAAVAANRRRGQL